MMDLLWRDVVVNICFGLLQTGFQVTPLRNAPIVQFAFVEIHMRVMAQPVSIEQRQELALNLQHKQNHYKQHFVLKRFIMCCISLPLLV